MDPFFVALEALYASLGFRMTVLAEQRDRLREWRCERDMGIRTPRPEVPVFRPLVPIFIALFMAPNVSVAEAPDSLVKGERICVVSRCRVAPDQAPADCGEGDQEWTYTGQLESLDPGSLHLRAQANNGEVVIPTSSIARLYASDGTKGHFWAGAGIGLVGGALLGAAIGSTTEFCIDSCTDEQAKAGAIGVGAVLGAPVGFLLGGVIGSQIRSDRWRLVPIADQRIGVGPRLGTLGVRVDVRF